MSFITLEIALVPVMEKCWFRWCGGNVGPFHVTWKIKWSFHNSRKIKSFVFHEKIYIAHSVTWFRHFISKVQSYSTLPHSYTSVFFLFPGKENNEYEPWRTRKEHFKKESRSAWQQTRIFSRRNSRLIAINVSYIRIRVSSVKVSKIKFIAQKETETYKICLSVESKKLVF